MKAGERVIIDPRIQHGKPVIRGTRVPVARLIAEMAGGMSKEEIMREYGIEAEDNAAALSFVATRSDAGESQARRAEWYKAAEDPLFIENIEQIDEDFRCADAEGID